MQPIPEYEHRLRLVERRARLSLWSIPFYAVVVGVLLATRPATSQAPPPQTFQVPFRVVDSKGEVLFEVTDNLYGGKMTLYVRQHVPILEASGGELVRGMIIHGTGKGSKLFIGANTRNGFVILEGKDGKAVFHKP